MSAPLPPPGPASGPRAIDRVPAFLAGLGLILAAAGVFLLLEPRTRLGGALLLAAGATAYRASRMVRVARLVEDGGAEALVVARAWSGPTPGSRLTRVGLVAVPVATLAAVALVLTVGHARFAPYVAGLGALSMLDLALGQWVDRRCQARLGARSG